MPTFYFTCIGLSMILGVARLEQVGRFEPMHIWLAILAGHMARCGLSVTRFLQGKWRSIAVDIETTAA